MRRVSSFHLVGAALAGSWLLGLAAPASAQFLRKFPTTPILIPGLNNNFMNGNVGNQGNQAQEEDALAGPLGRFFARLARMGFPED